MTNQEHFLKELGKINNLFKSEYEYDMLIILHKLIADNLCVEDLCELAQKRGINNLLDIYYKHVSSFEDDEEGDY